MELANRNRQQSGYGLPTRLGRLRHWITLHFAKSSCETNYEVNTLRTTYWLCTRQQGLSAELIIVAGNVYDVIMTFIFSMCVAF